MTTADTGAELLNTSRSIISRITSPFKAKPRHVSDYYIKVNEPHRRYSPGDVVKGSVVLTLQKPLRITHIVLCLHGFVRVFKNPIAPGEGISREGGFIAAGRGQRGTEYFGNGFASIFEDEYVLHGEARLTPATWTMGFEMEFPPAGIPSSIDFERGTISYVLTSTLTRPVTLNPTMTCDRKIYLMESLDIAPLRRPKPRVITLEPIPKRPRNRTASRATPSQASRSSANVEANITARPPVNDTHSIRSSDGAGQSPAPSEISSTGAESSSNASFRVRSGPSVPPSSIGNEPRASGTPTPDKTITAAVELLHAGCLPGETISVRISIDHTKPIVSTNGIIVTLYRQGRVDMHPALPLGPSEPGKKPQYEDYYPRSRTGLGGLSLSSAASTQGFRMDLDQSFTPLIVDPDTLTAVVKASVRVPENVFPTISNTPGSMINFSYFVEVIIDLRGKLTLPDRIWPRLGIKDSPRMHGYMDTMTWRSVGLPDPYHSQGTNFADTDQIRREKSVVNCSFEVVVGTKDSARKGTKRPEEASEQWHMAQHQILARDVEDQEEDEGARDEETQPQDWTPHGDRQDQSFDQHYPQGSRNETYSDDPYQPGDPPAHIPFPPASPEPQDEKARIRRAEAQLLPSAPPLADDEGVAGSSAAMPSAPPFSALYRDYDPSRHHHHHHPARYHAHGTPHPDEASPVYSRAGPSAVATPFPAIAPDAMAVSPPFSRPPPPGPSDDAVEDKQELERRRLMADESAPPPEDGEDDPASRSGQGVAQTAWRPRPPEANRALPSAPVLDDDDDDDGGGGGGDGSTIYPEAAGPSSSAATGERSRSETLPRYQK